MAKQFSHPLEPFVLALMRSDEQHRCMDEPKLAYAMAGGFVRSMGKASPFLSYGVVARDVLEVMRRNGVLSKDERGWYRPVNLPEAEGVAPKFVATPTAAGLSFVCPKCKRTNAHSADLGHRVSHCPCWPDGYYLTNGEGEC